MKKSLLFLILPVFLLGVIVFAEDNNGSGEQEVSDHTGTNFTGLSTNAIACATAAVTARDAAIKWWMAAYYATWTSTFDARTAAFIAALSLTNRKEMKKAMDLAWKTSEKAMRAAQKLKKNVVQKAWNAYRVSLKACNTETAKWLMQERGRNDLDD